MKSIGKLTKKVLLQRSMHSKVLRAVKACVGESSTCDEGGEAEEFASTPVSC